ncbi:MAG: hypothetical protein JRF43_01100 [Deltaproteobacteria bacterium]|nr:hypothetical protein [Deltaproteobacteria bacterium]
MAALEEKVARFNSSETPNAVVSMGVNEGCPILVQLYLFIYCTFLIVDIS